MRKMTSNRTKKTLDLPNYRLPNMFNARSMIKFVKRIECNCWHPDHVMPLSRLFKKLSEELSELDTGWSKARRGQRDLNSHISKMQWILSNANFIAKNIEPLDQRERGVEIGSYSEQGYRDSNGMAELQKYEDRERARLKRVWANKVKPAKA